jgi:hypothetical protein
MTWKDKIALDLCTSSPTPGSSGPGQMTPGLTGTYNSELRDKAAQHTPPVPPEYMGLEGQYDPCGLVHRLAQALDQDTQLSKVDTMTLAQQGGVIAITGWVKNRQLLDQIVEIAEHLDGTRSVDVRQVTVKSGA